MIKFQKFLMIAVVSMLAVSCASVPWDPQGYAGISHADIEFTQVYTDTKDGTHTFMANVPKRIRYWDGKEKQAITLEASIVDGKVTYTAGGVTAFLGQAQRADVEKAVNKAIADAGVQIAPEIIKGIVDAITGVPK